VSLERYKIEATRRRCVARVTQTATEGAFYIYFKEAVRKFFHLSDELEISNLDGLLQEQKTRFLPWFLWDHIPDYRFKPVGLIVVEDGHITCDEMERNLLYELANSYGAFYEVIDSRPGRGLILKDIHSGVRIPIQDVDASRFYVRWDILYARVFRFRGFPLIDSVCHILPPPYLSILRDYVYRMLQADQNGEKRLSPVKFNKMIYPGVVQFNDLLVMLFSNTMAGAENPLDRKYFFSLQSSPTLDALKQIEKYYKTLENLSSADWLDLPIPGLKGRTPREAARTETGKGILRDLLKILENLRIKSERAGCAVQLNIESLRKELDIE
jgi:hypothetical protein